MACSSGGPEGKHAGRIGPVFSFPEQFHILILFSLAYQDPDFGESNWEMFHIQL